MKVKCFGIAREIVGSSEVEISPVVKTVADLRTVLQQKYPASTSLNYWMIAVNQAYANDDQAISTADEIALIPPVSGG